MKRIICFAASVILALMTAFSVAASPDETVDETEVKAEVVVGRKDYPEEEKTKSEIPENVPDIINIVLFGLSNDTPERDKNRTDSIILVTIDNVNRQLKFTSILRDIKAEIEGYEPQKINAAYRLGGHELALQTLNENFNLELKDFITVNFAEFEQIIDSFGGVDIVLSKKEAWYLYRDETLSEENKPQKAGLQHLNGIQTREYSRIRKIDSDVYRSERQRKVLTELVRIVSEMDKEDVLALFFEFADLVEDTSLTLDDISMIVSIPFTEYDIINNHIPDRELDRDVETIRDEHDESVWVFDKEGVAERINDIIYNRQPVEDTEE